VCKKVSTTNQRFVVSGLCLYLFCLSACPAVRGQSPKTPPKDLTTTSIEDLMNIEVGSVSKRQQKLSQIAAAILVITQEDIRRSRGADIPDLLRKEVRS
jgi:iron complex outermembrane receptor protein